MDTGITIWLATVTTLYSTGHWIGASVFLGLGFIGVMWGNRS